MPQPSIMPFTVHGNLTLYRQRFGWARLIIAFLITGIILARVGLVAWIATLAGLLVFIPFVLWAIKKRSVTITNTSIEHVTLFRRRITIPFSDMRPVKLFTMFIDPGFGFSQRLSIVSKSTSRLVILNTLYWSEDDVNKIVEALRDASVEVESSREIMDFQTVARDFPAHATTLERHPGKIGLILSGVMLVTVFAVCFYFAFR